MEEFTNKDVGNRAALIIKDYIIQKETELTQKYVEHHRLPDDAQIEEDICVLETYINEMKKIVEDLGYSNMIDVHFGEENICRKLREYDLSFFEIAINKALFKDKYFKELVKKWKLRLQIGKKVDREDRAITYYNDEYSLALTGRNEDADNIPSWYVSLTFSKNMKQEKVIEFIRDITDSLDYYDDAELAIGINQNHYISHLKCITEKMLENLERPKRELYAFPGDVRNE